MLVASITNPESEHFAGATRREQVQALDHVAMLELHEWLNHMRFRLFGDLRPWDQQDAVEETFIRTLDFANKMRRTRTANQRVKCQTERGQPHTCGRVSGEHFHE
jgi:hypothetical protein